MPEILPMKKHHLADCAAIAQSAPDPWTLKGLEAELELEGHAAFVVLCDGNVAGFACFSLSDDVAELLMIAIAPSSRKKGLGKVLLQRGQQWASEKNAIRMLLEVRVENKNAIALYEGQGFEILARRPRMYNRPVEDGFMMEKKLNSCY